MRRAIAVSQVLTFVATLANVIIGLAASPTMSPALYVVAFTLMARRATAAASGGELDAASA